MHLQNLSLLNYKNYEELNLEFTPEINVFVGKNGSGKTNILDAIYFLALTKSAFSSNDFHCIRKGEQFAILKGVFSTDERTLDISSSIQTGSKKVFREGQQEYDKFSDHIGKVPLVLIAPDDTELVKEGSEVRRKFFDGILSQVDKAYLDSLLRYNYALKSRNQLFKMFAETGKADYLAVESYDRILVEAGTYIYSKRVEFIRQFQPIFEKHYSFLSDDQETTNLTYASGLHEMEFAEGLKQARAKDMAVQRTSFGIHRDDYYFLLDSGEIKRFGSQGQQKSFVISLKLSQYNIFEESKNFKPLLLLDDIFDKLDDQRIDRLLSLISGNLGQLFITDARPHRTTELLKKVDKQVKVFKVSGGKVELT